MKPQEPGPVWFRRVNCCPTLCSFYHMLTLESCQPGFASFSPKCLSLGPLRFPLTRPAVSRQGPRCLPRRLALGAESGPSQPRPAPPPARGPRRCPRRATAHARGRSRRVRLGGSSAGGGDRRDAAASAPATGAAVTSAEGCGAPTVRPGGEVPALRAPGLRTAAGPSKDPERAPRTMQSPVPAGQGPLARDGDTRRPGPRGSLGRHPLALHWPL